VVALAPDGSITITGFTASSDLPTTRGAAQRRYGGGTGQFEDVPSDGFAARLDPSGSRLLYSTYLGGANDDVGNAVTVDDAGAAYVTGFTASTDFPTTRGALDTANEPDVTDGYVSKLDRNGRLVWSTYLGGTGYDFGFGVGIDHHRNVYVSGSTTGEFPVAPGAAQPEYRDNFDWYVARLDRSGAKLDWATYHGGTDFDGFTPTLAVDRTDHVDVVGATFSSDFPTTRDAIQRENAGGLDVGIARFGRDGRLLFSSYYGGSGDDDNGGSMPFVDPDVTLFLGGATGSHDYPVTPGAVQTTYGGGEIDGHVTAVAFGR
jgi:Beta-propeller repeat